MESMTTMGMQQIAQIEERLTISKATLKELANQKFALDQHAIVAVTDVQSTITYVNDKLCTISRYSKDELIGQNHRILNSGHHPKEFFKQMYDDIGNGKAWHGEIKNRAKDGSFYWVAATIVRTPTTDGEPHQDVAICVDITKRKLAEEALNESGYRGLLEAAPDAMVVVNQGGEIVLVNVQAEKQFGYRRDELLGQKVKNIIPKGFAERLLADGLRSAADALAQQIGTGIELNGRRKDGSEFPIEIMLSPLESVEGILVTAAIRDISARKAAEEHLVQMESRYRGLLEAAPDAMVVVKPAGEIVLLNVQAEKQFGYSRDELLGQEVKNIIPEGFAERLIADGTRSAADALAQQIGTGIELSARRKDGSKFPIEIMLSPLGSTEGILVTVAIRNISARKAGEKHLVQMESRYRGLLEAAPDAMVVVNQGGEIVLLNVQAEKQFGYRRDELVGQRVKNIIPEGFAERVIADATRSVADALAQQIGMGIELSGRRKDGSKFPIEIMLSPLESAEGILVTAAIRNISRRKAAEQHLVQMEGRYRGLLEAAPDAMVVVNQSGEIVLLNLQAEKQFGYRRDELVGQKVKNIIPEGFAERLIADGTRSAADALAQQIGMGIELSARRKDGSAFPIEIMLSPLQSAEGILVTAAIRDISARKKSEEDNAALENQATALQTARDELELRVEERTKELAAANQILEGSNLELKQFAYIASHDLQSPLRSISGFVQLLQLEYQGKLDEQAHDWIRRTVRAIEQMRTLIRDLLSYSRVDARARPFTQIPFLDIVKDALTLSSSHPFTIPGAKSPGDSCQTLWVTVRNWSS